MVGNQITATYSFGQGQRMRITDSHKKVGSFFQAHLCLFRDFVVAKLGEMKHPLSGEFERVLKLRGSHFGQIAQYFNR